MRTSEPHDIVIRLRLSRRLLSASFALLAGLVTQLSHAEITTGWVSAGQPLKAMDLKTALDDLQSQLHTAQAELHASQLSLGTLAGYGTTDTGIIRFSQVLEPADPTVLSSVTTTANGTVVTIAQDGVYAISAFLRAENASGGFTILRNASGAQLTGMASSKLVADAGEIAICGTIGQGAVNSCSTTVILRASDTIRIGSDGGLTFSGLAQSGLTVTQIRAL
ncbi:MAG: hypothetical protein U0414_20140 [Polyangiaceae bacterium]